MHTHGVTRRPLPKRVIFQSLFRRHWRQDYSGICAYFPGEDDRRQDDTIESSLEQPFETLARMAKREEWNFQRSQFKEGKYRNQRLPILTSFLNYTFLRLQDLGRLAYSEDDQKMCFNTGLQTKEEKDIFAVFFRHQAPDKFKRPQWVFDLFAESYHPAMRDFRPPPEIATYITDPGDLVFDPKLKVDVNYDHMINTPENKDRLPDSLKSNDRTALLTLKGSIESLRDKILRNYKVAIPHWYSNRIQLLLPLYLTNDAVADNALIVDKDKKSQIYLARTILTMDMAYIDARIITRPDREWLNP